MANAFKTSDAHLFIGNSAAAHDLTRYANGVEVGGAATVEAITTLGNTDVEKVPINTSTEFSVGTMYHGAGTDALRTLQGQSGVFLALLDFVNKNAYCGEVQWGGSEQSGPTDNIVTDSVTFFQNGLLSAGHGEGRVTRFDFSASDNADVTAGLTVKNTDRVFLVVDKVNTGGTLEFKKGSDAVTQAVAATGIFELDITGFPATVDSPVIGTETDLSGAATIDGYLLILENLGLD